MVDAIHVQGNLRFTDSARARLLFRTSYEGTITIEGPATPRDGLVGFMTRLATLSKPTLRVRDKMHLFTQEPVFDIRDYAGRIYYGQSQFYTEPKEPRFLSSGTRPARLILAGHFWYNSKPRLELGPTVTLTMVGNRAWLS